MIERVGLLPRGMHSEAPLAYEMYTNKDASLVRQYRKTFGISKTIEIEFMGVFDTVSSLWYTSKPEVQFAKSVKLIKYFRHALALDEHRKHFEAVSRVAAGGGPDDGQQIPKPPSHKEVWFCGAHSDVGGGNDKNDALSLSDIPLRWMLREATASGLKLGVMGLCTLKAVTRVPGVRELMGPAVWNLLGDWELAGEDERIFGPKLETAVQGAVKAYSTDDWLGAMVERAAAFDSDHKLIHEPFTEPRETRENASLKLLPQDQSSFWKVEDWGEKPRKILGGQRLHRSVQTRLEMDKAKDKDSKAKYPDKYGDGRPRAIFQQEGAEGIPGWPTSWTALLNDPTAASQGHIWED
jgi:hypothetical protein